MRPLPTALPDVRLFALDRRADERGWLCESGRADLLLREGLPVAFAQENLSRSEQGVLRGLHFQERQAQGKLLLVLVGEIFDVAVDLRAGSPTRGRHAAMRLSAQEPTLLWVPPGFAHGFYVTQGPALVSYKLTAAWAPAWERCLAWDDPELGIDWPLTQPPLLSERDRAGQAWRDLAPWSETP
mgnify:CR=1 FL=1